jgi:hypothetical protein
MAKYWVITSNAKGGAASPFTGDTARAVQMTEQELRQVYRDSGQIQDHFGSFETYMTYIGESQEWIQSADWMNATVEYGIGEREWLYNNREDVMYRPGERDKLQVKIQSDLTNAKQSAYMLWLNEGAELMDKWGLNRVIYNSDGDQFKWTGSGYQKTMKVDDHPSFGDYAKAIVTTAVTAAATFGISSTAAGATLNSFFTSAGLSSSAATAATSSIIASGIGATLGQDVTPESLLINALGAGLGAEVAGLANLSGAAGSALSATVSEAVVQGLTNGELDFSDLLQAGLLGGATAVGSDLFTALVKGQDFTFGGLIDEDSALWDFFNGEGGIITEVSAAFDKFYEQQITGGEWWESTTEDYKSINTLEDGTIIATRYDGTTQKFDNFKAFADAGFVEMTGKSEIWDLISKGTDSIPDSWYDALQDWLRDKASGGSYETESGTTITGPPTNETTDPDDFDCSSVNRQQVAGATTGTECGPCIEEYEANEFGECVATLGGDTCPEGQYYNEVTFECEDEVFFTKGQPCNTADGQQGIFDDEGGCYVPAGNGTGNGTGDSTDGNGNSTGGTGGTGGTGEPEPCSNGATIESGCELCEDGTRADEHQGGRCSGAYIDPQDPYSCSAGRPSAATFQLRTWNAMCEADYCNDGSRKQTVDGVYGANCAEYVAPTPIESCADPDRRTTNSGSCAELCNDGTIPDQHEEGLCGNPMIATTGGEEQNGDGGDTDCTLVECDAPRPEGEAGVAWDECCSDPVVDLTPDDGEPDCTLVECESPRPEGIEGALWDECCTETAVLTPSSGGSSGGSGNSGGRGSSLGKGMFDSNSISMGGDPQLLAANQFPITDFLAQVFKPKKPQNNGGGMLT